MDFVLNESYNIYLQIIRKYIAMNTQLEYLYHNAGNYKWFGEVVISGALKRVDIEPYLYEHQFFIPSEVGLPDLQPEKLTEEDHIWHEIVSLKETKAEPTVEISAGIFVEGFKATHAVEWNWLKVMERKGFC